MADDCIFCAIAAGRIPAKKVYEDADVVAFEDISPKAPVHVVIIPREHVPTVNELVPGKAGLAGAMFKAAAEIARKLDIAESGYRVVANCNRDAGQEVFHVHFHLLGGRAMQWPPG